MTDTATKITGPIYTTPGDSPSLRFASYPQAEVRQGMATRAGRVITARGRQRRLPEPHKDHCVDFGGTSMTASPARDEGTPQPAAPVPAMRLGPDLGAPLLLTCREAGDYTGLGERYMRRLIDEERITFVRIGALVRFQREDLDAFVAQHRVPAKPSPPAAP